VQLKDSRYGSPPHPITVRSGQIYWPLTARSPRHQLRVTRVLPDGSVRARRMDGALEQLTVRADRLLAAEHGGGTHYRFVGWVSRSYRTWACAVGRTESQVVLILPEWHPAFPVRVVERLLPTGTTVPGGWVLATADLSAAVPARLSVALIERCEDPGRAVCSASLWIGDGR
jgi:hypothetical protein